MISFHGSRVVGNAGAAGVSGQESFLFQARGGAQDRFLIFSKICAVTVRSTHVHLPDGCPPQAEPVGVLRLGQVSRDVGVSPVQLG